MNDILCLLKQLNRPRLLVQAARFGLSDYQRQPRLERMLKCKVLPGPVQTAYRLLAMEQDCEDARRERQASYSAAFHIEVLVALMAEAQLIAARRQDVQEKASATSPLRRSTYASKASATALSSVGA